MIVLEADPDDGRYPLTFIYDSIASPTVSPIGTVRQLQKPFTNRLDDRIQSPSLVEETTAIHKEIHDERFNPYFRMTFTRPDMPIFRFRLRSDLP